MGCNPNANPPEPCQRPGSETQWLCPSDGNCLITIECNSSNPDENCNVGGEEVPCPNCGYEVCYCPHE